MLTSAEKRTLKAKAHSLKPVVIVGQQGVTPGVLAAVGEALDVHELIKVRLPMDERPAQAARIQQLAQDLAAETIGFIGRVLILYRKRPD